MSSLLKSKKRAAVVVGFDYHVDVLCNKMNAHSSSWRFVAYRSTRLELLRAALKLRKASALITFAGPGPHPLLTAAARAYDVPIVVIWAGTDVVKAVEDPSKSSHGQRTQPTHLAVAPWLVDELKQAGIVSRYIPIIGVKPIADTQLPSEFRVFTYLPQPRRDFYGRPHVYEVARRLPNVHFSVIGKGGWDASAPRNVHFLGWISDVPSLIKKSTALLRVPEHDGMSLVVLEALARGRFVAWKYSIPGVRQVSTPDDSVNFLRELQLRHSSNQLSLNREGLEFIASAYEERQVSAHLETVLDELVCQAERVMARPHRIAIMGHELFAADVVNLNNAMQTNWNAQLLQFDGRYATAAALFQLVKADAWHTVGTPEVNRHVGRVAYFLRKPRVMHWVGTDIEVARRRPSLVARLRRPFVTHLTEVEWEVEELREIGIDADIAPLPPRLSPAREVPPLPSVFTLLTYLPMPRTNFYGIRQFEAVVQELHGRRVRFLVVGGGEVRAPAGSQVENLGWCYSLDEVYAQSSVLLRFTARDGLSLMVLEALALGRHALWTKKFPFVRHVQSVDDIVTQLNDLLRLHDAGELRPQFDASAFVLHKYDREKCIANLVRSWETTLSKEKRVPDETLPNFKRE